MSRREALESARFQVDFAAAFRPATAWLAALVILGMLMTGCSSGGGTAGAPDEARVAIVGPGLVSSPLLGRGPEACDVQAALFRGLLYWTSDGLHQACWTSGLPSAKDHVFRSLGLAMAEYQFTLRPDARWSDGQPLTSNDFMFSYRMAVHPLFRKEHASWTAYIKQFELSSPSNLKMTVHRSSVRDVVDFLPLPAHLLEPGMADPQHFVELPYHQMPVGNGPFKVTRQSTDRIDAEVNPHYAPARPALKRLRFQVYATMDEALAALQKGDVDVVPRIPMEKVAPWRKQPFEGIDLEVRAAERLTMLVFNTQHRLVEKVGVRRALARGLERRKLLAQIAGQNGVYTDSWLQPWNRGYAGAFASLPHDQARAVSELQRAGWRIDSEGHLRSGTRTEAVTLLYDAERSDQQAVVLALREAWKKMGISVGLLPLDRESYEERLRKGDFTVALQEIEVEPWTQPASFLSKESIPIPRNSFRGSNVSRWSKPAHEKLLMQIAGAEAPTAALGALKEQQEMLASELPILPLFFNVRISAHRKGLQGVQDRGFGEITWNVEKWFWK